MRTKPVFQRTNEILVLGTLVVSLVACQPPTAQDTDTYWLRSKQPDPEAACTQIVAALFEKLEASRVLPQGYPQLGNLEIHPDASDPSVQVMHCMPGVSLSEDQTKCILMNDQGDFLRAQAITWESAAFFMYRIYITSKSPFARVNMAKGFIALDVFLQANPNLWGTTDEIIHIALVEMGAHPFRP